MSNNLKDKDEKSIENRRKIFRVCGIVCSIITGICFLLMLLAGEFDLETFLLFLLFVFLAVISKKKE